LPRVVRQHGSSRAAFFAEGAVYHTAHLEPVTGGENIVNTIASVLCPGPPGIEGIDSRVINNVSAASQQYLAAVAAYASGPVTKYLGVLAAADVYTASTTFVILESVRLDLGVGSQVHA
jgi:hypothetical protein